MYSLKEKSSQISQQGTQGLSEGLCSVHTLSFCCLSLCVELLWAKRSHIFHGWGGALRAWREDDFEQRPHNVHACIRQVDKPRNKHFLFYDSEVLWAVFVFVVVAGFFFFFFLQLHLVAYGSSWARG